MLGRLFERSIDSVSWRNDAGWGAWPGDGGSGTWAGVHVDEDTATQLLAVYGSASLITDELSGLPIDVKDAERPAWIDEPSEGLSRMAWLGQITWSLLLSGNAYLAVMYGGRGIVGMDVLDPDSVRPVKENGRKVFYVQGQPARFEICHIPGRMRPGALAGMSPVEWARQTIGIGLAAGRYGAEFFDGEGNMPGVIEIPGDANPTTMSETAKFWKSKRSRVNRGLPGVLKGGATWKPTGVTNEQAQFLATRKYTDAQIAAQMFLLDPADLGIPVEGSTMTYLNQQQRDHRRLTIAIMPWIRRDRKSTRLNSSHDRLAV